VIQDKTLADITSHAEKEFPRESCGLIVDNFGKLEYVKCENKSDDPLASFLIDPVVYASLSSKIMCVVHSHPNRSSKLSQADIASSERCMKPFMVISYPTCEISNYYPTGFKTPLEGRQFVYSVMDCFTIIRDFYKWELGIEIEDRQRRPYGWWEEPGASSYLMEDYQKWGFEKVLSPKRGDVIVMQLQGTAPNHVAVYTGDGVMIHHTLNNISRSEMYGGYWRKNTICILRHNQMVNR